MTTPAFRGVIPPVLTPLDESGAFDEAAFERLVERLVAAGVHGLFVLGSSGEVASSPTASAPACSRHPFASPRAACPSSRASTR